MASTATVKGALRRTIKDLEVALDTAKDLHSGLDQGNPVDASDYDNLQGEIKNAHFEAMRTFEAAEGLEDKPVAAAAAEPLEMHP